MSNNHPRKHVENRAFTLVEVLMAVLILAIGLLGLGAVLPMVVRQQRQSADGTFGTLAIKSAITTLQADRTGGDESRTILIRPEVDDETGESNLGGTFRLSVAGVFTPLNDPIDAFASAQTVQDALNDLAPVAGGCTVTLAVNSAQTRQYSVKFSGRLGRANLRNTANGEDYLTIDPANLTGVQSTTVALAPNGGPDLSPEFFTRWAAETGTGPGPGLSPRALLNVLPQQAEWMPVLLDEDGFGRAELGISKDDNGLRLDRTYFIPLSERLYPPDSAGVHEPQFVWDLAVRRAVDVKQIHWNVGIVPAPARKVQVAVFMRRLDPRLAIPRTATAYTLFIPPTGQISGPPPFWPVSVDNTGRPTLNGAVSGPINADHYHGYSSPIALGVNFAIYNVGGDQRRDRLTVDVNSVAGSRGPLYFTMISQPGQQIVDNLGNIYTVIGPDKSLLAPPFSLTISPPVPTGLVETPPQPVPAQGPTISQVVFTPQVPVAVYVYMANP